MIFSRKEMVNPIQEQVEAELLPASWPQTLKSIAGELKVVAGTTEDEFLAIGARLQDFYQRSSGISSLACGMVGQAAGDDLVQSMKGLAEMLDQMERYVSQARKDTEVSSETMREILQHLESISTPLSSFKKINKVLRMLGISTKIESARLGQSAAGFDTLASDVGELSVQVNEKAGIVLARKEELRSAIEQTLTGVLTSGAHQHGLVLNILEKTRVSLQSLTQINTRCSSAASGISEISEEVSRNIGEVVMSMQAHDIVRQQIEHVDETLRDLAGGLTGGAAGADDVACICELQMAQLKHASNELEQAVQAISVNLREIARKQSSLSRETGSMAGIADQAGESFFSDMARDISVVTGAIVRSSDANQSLCQAMSHVADTVGEIAACVGDIETIGEEIKLIALNAQIKSAYTGEEGAALGVLAEAIQRLSVDAIDHTNAVSGTLKGILGVTQRLSEGVNVEAGVLQSEVHDMVERLSSLLESLRTVNEALHGSLSGMDGEVCRLSDDIEETTAGITVHAKVSRVLGRAVEGLSQLFVEARRIAPASPGGANLEALAGRYTMHSERKIHNSLVEGGAMLPPLASASDDGFGDNVELF